MQPAVVIDAEWGFEGGRLDCETAFMPVVLCAWDLGADRAFSFPGRDGRHALAQFVEDRRDHVFVAHAATAEMKYLLRMQIRPPEKWFCTMTAFRHTHNRPGYLESSLVASLIRTGLGALVPTDKNDIRERILRLSFTDADFPAITNYCREDVAATAALYRALVGRVDPAAMSYWCEYMKAVAKMELRGIPIDTRALRALLDNRCHVRKAIMDKVNQTAAVFRDDAFSRKAFLGWAGRQGIVWPRRPSPTTGRLYRALDDETLEAMEVRHAFIREVRQAKKTLKSLDRHAVKVDGQSRRHYFSTMPFRSVTGRNQPKRFVFSAAKWMRWLVVPPDPEHVLVYVDFTAQEIGVAAALSGDEAMTLMYGSADPHLAFAIMAGAAPPGATKVTHPGVRVAYKTVNLGVLYGQSEYGVADRLGIGVAEAAAILNKHRRIFGVYHRFADRAVSAAYGRRYATTRLGWRAHVPPDPSRRRTWLNFPIQATGAEVMRVMTIALDRQGVQVLAVVHDGWLLTCRRGEQDRLRAAVEAARAVACEKVLGGFALRVDWTEYADRFRDEGGEEMWDFIRAQLPVRKLYVPAE